MRSKRWRRLDPCVGNVGKGKQGKHEIDKMGDTTVHPALASQRAIDRFASASSPTFNIDNNAKLRNAALHLHGARLLCVPLGHLHLASSTYDRTVSSLWRFVPGPVLTQERLHPLSEDLELCPEESAR